MICLYLILPCYNESEILPWSITTIAAKMNELIKTDKVAKESKLIFVDDGSADDTWSIIEEYQSKEKLVAGIKLGHNVGHQKALLAGMMFARKIDKADAVITIDADLQQDINAIDDFLDKYKDGYDIVYGVRTSRKTDNWVKKDTAKIFYSIMHLFSSKESIENSADYRLMSKKALSALSEYGETNLYLRGLIPLVGLNSTQIYFDVHERKMGKSKYTLSKMLALAMDGMTSFSIRPIRIVTGVGLIVFFVSVCMLIYIFIAWLRKESVSGWTSLAMATWLLGGIELLAMGIIGEYVGKTYFESKKRPRYFIESVLFEDVENK